MGENVGLLSTEILRLGRSGTKWQNYHFFLEWKIENRLLLNCPGSLLGRLVVRAL